MKWVYIYIYIYILTAWWLLFCKKLHETQGCRQYSMNYIYIYIYIYIYCARAFTITSNLATLLCDMDRWPSGKVLALHSSGGDHSMHCWWYAVPSISFQTFLYRYLTLLYTLENSLCYCYTYYEKTGQFLWFQLQMNSYSRNWNTPY